MAARAVAGGALVDVVDTTEAAEAVAVAVAVAVAFAAAAEAHHAVDIGATAYRTVRLPPTGKHSPAEAVPTRRPRREGAPGRAAT